MNLVTKPVSRVSPYCRLLQVSNLQLSEEERCQTAICTCVLSIWTKGRGHGVSRARGSSLFIPGLTWLLVQHMTNRDCVVRCLFSSLFDANHFCFFSTLSHVMARLPVLLLLFPLSSSPKASFHPFPRLTMFFVLMVILFRGVFNENTKSY